MNINLNDIVEKLKALPKDELDKLAKKAKKAVQQLGVGKWVPNPGPQTEAFFCEADEVFYGGSAGGGKTDLALGLALTRHEKSLILREYLDDARDMAERMLQINGSRDGWNGQLLSYRGDGRYIDFGGCRSDDEKQRFKGKPHDLIVFDEVGDFLESVYKFIIVWNRSTKPGQRCRILACGNPPTRPEGLWVIRRWAAWLDPKHPKPAKSGEIRWYIMDADGKEREVEGRGPYEINGEKIFARSRTFIRAKLQDNPDLMLTNYEANLSFLPPDLRAAYRDGKFDESLADEPNQLIPTAWVVAAQKRWTPKPPDGVPMCAIGVDASGGGRDPMIIAKRYDGWYAPMVEVPGKSIPMEMAGAFSGGIVVSHRRDNALVVIDMGGGYGGSMYEHLTANGVETRAYKGAEKTPRRSRCGKLKFTNKRTAAYWLFREALEPDQPGGSPIALPDDPEIIADLTAVTFKSTPNGIQAESKEDVVERLGRSTDKGDAIVMAWFEGPRETTDALEWIERRQQNKRGFRPKIISGGRQPLSAQRRAG